MSNEQNILEKKCILKQYEPKKSHYYSVFLYNLQALRQKDRPILPKFPLRHSEMRALGKMECF